MSKKTTTKKEIKAKLKAVKKEGERKIIALLEKEGMSGLDAAALVLRESKQPMNAKEIVAEIQERKLAPKLGGKTPHATIYAAIITEIAKSEKPRFARGEAKGTFIARA